MENTINPATTGPEAWIKVPLPTSDLIDPIMIQPVAAAGKEGYVPLCSAIHWIMTEGGARQVTLDAHEAWTSASHELRLFIQTGEVGLIGQPRSGPVTETIRGEMFGLIKMVSPADLSFFEVHLDAPSFVACISFVGSGEWSGGMNDQLFERWEPKAIWTNLQVKKSDILRYWSRPAAKIKAKNACLQWLSDLMDPAQGQIPIPKPTVWTMAREKFVGISKRQFLRAWDEAIAVTCATAWSKPGPRTRKSNHRTS